MEDDWQDLGACKGQPYELFFGSDGEETGRDKREKRAKAICGQCRVEPECLEFALENGEKFGIWGGLTEKERKKERDRRRRKLTSERKKRENQLLARP